MIHGSESFVQFGQSNFELAFTVADITLQSTERLVDLQMKTAKEALEQGLRNVHAFSDAKNVQDLVDLQSKAAQPSLEKALDYSRDVYAVATDAQMRIGKILKTRMHEFGGAMMKAVDQAAQSAAGAETTAARSETVSGASNDAHAAVPQRANHTKRKAVVAKRTFGKRKAAKKKAR